MPGPLGTEAGCRNKMVCRGVKQYISTGYITHCCQVILSSSSCLSFRNAGKHGVSPLCLGQLPLRASKFLKLPSGKGSPFAVDGLGLILSQEQ